MHNSELKNVISELLELGFEGGFWDYKEDYTDCKEDKLIDIICMANNIEDRDAYLIYGVSDDGIVIGIEHTSYSRYTTKSITEFLRSKPFAGGYIPKASVQVIKIENHEIDIVIIHNTRNTPYYLTEEYNPSHNNKKKLSAGAIYTRVNDVNTPRVTTASYEHTEWLWRKRFGMNLTPSEKLPLLLENRNDWSNTRWEAYQHSYNKYSPEYQICVKESADGYETLRYFYDDERMSYAPLKLNYLTTTLYETELWYMDMGRCLIPKPEVKYSLENHYLYYYIELDSVNGKLLPLLAYGKNRCNNRSGQQMPVLIFENECSRLEFESWMLSNISLKEEYIEKIKKNAIFQHILNKEKRDGTPECGVLEVATTFAFYKKWIMEA